MNDFFRAKWLPAGLVIVLLAGNVKAQAPENTTSSIVFGDGLGLTVPFGWKITALDTAAAPEKRTSDFTNPDTLTMLAHVKPAEPGRTASLTILRDNSFGGHAGPSATKEAQVRLNEIAMVQGYRPDKFSNQGSTNAPDHVLLVEIDGVASNGQHRIFTCISINRFPSFSLRCYWEYDLADPTAKREFDAWLAALTFNGGKVADILSGSSEMIADNVSRPKSPSGLDSTLSSSSPTPNAFGDRYHATEAAVTMIPSRATGELINKNRDSLVVIQGDKGTGSGFVCNLEGEPWLLTNAHVLGDNPHPKFTSLGGAAVKNGTAFLAVDHDICKIKMPAGTQSIEVMSGVDANAKIGDPIVVVGNAEGAGVIRPFEGHIVGIGPNLVEVDAPFVPGNSGSPIIHVPSGKAIGIATYLISRKVDSKGNGSVETQVRRFGYRIDNVKSWEPVDWNLFYLQSAQVAQIEATGGEFESLFADARDKKLFSTRYQNAGIQRALDKFAGRVKGGKSSGADLDFARRELLSNLRLISLADVRSFDSKRAYDYFRREVANETRFREEIYAAFTRSLNYINP